MAFMTKDGFRLYYEDTGGNAPTIMFLHGAGGNHLSWWQQVPAFADEYRCITVDQRVFGQSPDEETMRLHGRIEEDPHPGHLGNHLLEQFQPFRADAVLE